MKKYNFRIHDFVTFSITDNASYLKSLADNIYIQFENFRSEPEISEDLAVEIGGFSPDLSGTTVLDDKYWVKENYIYTKGRRKFATWQMDIRVVDEEIRYRIDTNIAGAVTKPHFFTEFLIQYLLSKRGVSVVHSAALEAGDGVILLPGTSGGGKTTICMSLMEDGYGFMGDNYSIIYNDEIYSYNSPLNVFSYNLVPMIRENLSKIQLFDLKLRLMIFRLSGGYIKIFKKVNPNSIVPRVSKKGVLRHMVFLVPCAGDDVSIADISRNTAIDRLYKNMEIEWVDTANIFESFSYAVPNVFDGYWSSVRKNLDKNISGINRFFEISVPTKYSDCSRDMVMKLIQDTVNTYNG